MNYNDFCDVVTDWYEFNEKSTKYIDSIPSDLRESVYNNEYINNTSSIFDIIAKKYFGDLYEDICWFIYECNDRIKAWQYQDSPPNVTIHGREYWINDLQSYLHYAKIELFDNELGDAV